MTKPSKTVADALGAVAVTPNAVTLAYDRYTATTNFYYEQAGEEPISIQSVVSEVFSTAGEEPYRRKFVVAKEWQELDYGWLKGRVGTIIIQNKNREANLNPQTPSSAEELAQGIEVSFVGEVAHITVPKGHTIPITPVDPTTLRLRAVGDNVRCEIMVMPK
jgi:hypothetical protein